MATNARDNQGLVTPVRLTNPEDITGPGAGASSTSALSNVSSSATSVTLLAANSARLGATIWNDSTSVLYVKLGPTAAATSTTVKVPSDGYYEVPYKYAGIIDGIWASANGAARITEFT